MGEKSAVIAVQDLSGEDRWEGEIKVANRFKKEILRAGQVLVTAEGRSE